jgi:hypothetical protein
MDDIIKSHAYDSDEENQTWYVSILVSKMSGHEWVVEVLNGHLRKNK